MRFKKMSKKQLAVSILSSALLIQAAYNNEVFATDITGIAQNQQTGAFDIRPEAIKGETGFRKYTNFELTKGDVANFIFEYLKAKDGSTTEFDKGSISKFVNLVDGKASINGIVNALDSVNGALKTDGQLIFVSPNGLVVGASGVLNVGSLSVFTPTQNAYNQLKRNVISYETIEKLDADHQIAVTSETANWDEANVSGVNRGTGVIQIQGKIAARGDINLDGGSVLVESTGQIFGGINESNTQVFKAKDETSLDYNPASEANTLFNSLVNSKMSEGNTFQSENGGIVITTKTGTTVSEGGLIVNNNGSEDAAFTISNSGTDGINIYGELANTNGTLTLENTNGAILIDETGVINNVGKLNIYNQQNNSGLTINGTINNEGVLDVINKSGTNGMIIGSTAKINNKGDATFTNLSNAFEIKKNAIITNEEGKANADGEVTTEGKLTIHNQSSAGTLSVKGTVNSNGNELLIQNDGTEMVISGTVNNNKGIATIKNTNGQLLVDTTGIINGQEDSTRLTMVNTGLAGLNIKGKVNNINQLVMQNEGEGGFNVSGSITNNGTMSLTNTKTGTKGFNLESSGRITNNGENGSVDITNEAVGGMNIKGIVKTNNNSAVALHNKYSDIVIGDDTGNNYYIDSDGEVTVELTDGNLRNFGVAKTLIRTTNQGQDNLIIVVENGAIGEEVEAGLGEGARDWTKSINTNIDGTITAKSTAGEPGTAGANKSYINIASANKDMRLNTVEADGKVVLLADDMTTKGGSAYNILNYNTTNSANVKGSGISMIASGHIGKEGENAKAVTIIQTNGKFNAVAWNHYMNGLADEYTPSSQEVIEILAKGDILINGMDEKGSTKVDANVGSIISQNGSVNAEFSGNTYIKEITAAKDVNVTDRGSIMYVANVGETTDYKTSSYYGANNAVNPQKANFKVLDLGTKANPNEKPDSTLVIKNGKIAGNGEMRPGTQDVTLTADNIYAGGYYFNMGGNRGTNGKTTAVRDARTNDMVNTDGSTPITLRAKAVRKSDVTETGRNETEREYYYGGSSQGYDADYENDGKTIANNQKETENDDDNLVVSEPTEPTSNTQTPEPTENTQTPEPTENTQTPEPTENTQTPEPTENTQTPEPTENTQTPEPTENTQTPEPTENTQTPEPTENTQTPEPTENTQTPEPTENTQTPEPTAVFELPVDRNTVDNSAYIQRQDTNTNVAIVDDTQYIKIDASQTSTPVELVENYNAMAQNVVEVIEISRGGATLAHNNTLKTGDTFPIHIKYGDIDINTQVKVVNASTYRAETEYINADPSTVNKLLYLSLIVEGEAKGDKIPASIGNITSLSYNR